MGLRIGYARVSTQDQQVSLQRDELVRAGCTTIYADKASGSRADRPELQQCLKALRPGDTLVVWRLDRLGRNLTDLIAIVTDLEQRGIGFESRMEHIETTTPSGKLMFHVFSALAEFERNLIRERVNAGLAAARARGRVGGRPSKMSEKDKAHARAMLADPNITVGAVADRFGISRQTLYRQLGVIRPAADMIDNDDFIIEPTGLASGVLDDALTQEDQALPDVKGKEPNERC